MSLTRKDFNAIADAIAEIEHIKDREVITTILIPILSRSNERFDEKRFRGYISERVSLE